MDINHFKLGAYVHNGLGVLYMEGIISYEDACAHVQNAKTIMDVSS